MRFHCTSRESRVACGGLYGSSTQARLTTVHKGGFKFTHGLKYAHNKCDKLCTQTEVRYGHEEGQGTPISISF